MRGIRPLEPYAWKPAHYAQPKLTPAQRDEIACLRGEGKTLAELAATYGVSTSVIHSISIRERT